MTPLHAPRLMAAALWLASGGLMVAQQPASPAPAASPNSSIDGVQGVKQDAVESIKKVVPGTVNPAAVTQAAGVHQVDGVNKVDGINTVNGVKAPAQNAVQPPPPPPPPATVNKVDGLKAPAQNAVQPPPPPPPAGVAVPVGGGAVGAVNNIRAVHGVQGIQAPVQQNLEAALLMKQGGGGRPTGGAERGGGKGKAAAAALLAPNDKAPVKNGPLIDGRGGFQEFEKLTTPGS